MARYSDWVVFDCPVGDMTGLQYCLGWRNDVSYHDHQVVFDCLDEGKALSCPDQGVDLLYYAQEKLVWVVVHAGRKVAGY